LEVLRALSLHCSHHVRGSMLSCGALEVLLRRFPSRAVDPADGAGCTWAGAVFAQGHLVCRVSECTMLSTRSDGLGEGVALVQGKTVDIYGDDADAVCKVSKSPSLALCSKSCHGRPLIIHVQCDVSSCDLALVCLEKLQDDCSTSRALRCTSGLFPVWLRFKVSCANELISSSGNKF
jgi:hypothetical protein